MSYLVTLTKLQASLILVLLSHLLLLDVAQLVSEVSCFSTPSSWASQSSSSTSSKSGTSRLLSTSTRTRTRTTTTGHKQENEEYTNNYITAIEDQTTEPAGFMVSTTDHNYAIKSPRLGELEWLGVSVNGGQVFILTNENRTLSANLYGLTEDERDFIVELRANFTNNLAGLKFAYYTSGSTLALTNLAPMTFGYGKTTTTTTTTKTDGNGRGASRSQYLTTKHQQQSAASKAFGQLINLNYESNNLLAQRRMGFALGASPEPTSGGSAPEDLSYSLAQPPAVSGLGNGARYKKRSRIYAAPQAVGGGRRYLSHTGEHIEYGQTTRGFRGARNQQQVNGPRHTGNSYHLIDEDADELAPFHKRKFSKCKHQDLINFNYYNLNRADTGVPLNRTLAGDIYYFDFHCNLLDVYSTSVSVRRQPDSSLLYRDHRYFSYSRSQLPLEINRLFLVGDQVFFVYNDGSLLLKQSWMLDPTELNLVLNVRQELMSISEWQVRAASLLSKGSRQSGGVGGSMTTPAPEEPASTEANTTTTTTTTTTRSDE